MNSIGRNWYGANMSKANNVRDNALRAMDDDQLRKVAPSIFAEAAHESRSARYCYIPTHHLVDALRGEGFYPVQAGQSKSRLGRHEHTKHMVKFARLGSADGGVALGEVVPQVALINSHDGSSAYDLIGGLFRFACFNGLLVSESCVQSFKIPHTGNIRDRVIEGSFSVIEGAGNAGRAVQEWKGITLDEGEQRAFANAAALLRWDDETKAPPINTSRLLDAHRYEDGGADLWRTFNRVQENLVRGGTRGRSATGRRLTTRPIDGIDGNVKLNRALWALAESMATMKAA